MCKCLGKFGWADYWRKDFLNFLLTKLTTKLVEFVCDDIIGALIPANDPWDFSEFCHIVIHGPTESNHNI